jgi:hypothetical protein
MAEQRGIVRPFRLGANGDPVTGTGEDLRVSRIGQAVGTRCIGPGSAGEVAWSHRFGSRFEQIRQTSFNAMRAPLAYVYAKQATETAIPDELVEKVEVTFDDVSQEVTALVFSRSKKSNSNPVKTQIKVPIQR